MAATKKYLGLEHNLCAEGTFAFGTRYVSNAVDRFVQGRQFDTARRTCHDRRSVCLTHVTTTLRLTQDWTYKPRARWQAAFSQEEELSTCTSTPAISRAGRRGLIPMLRFNSGILPTAFSGILHTLFFPDLEELQALTYFSSVVTLS